MQSTTGLPADLGRPTGRLARAAGRPPSWFMPGHRPARSGCRPSGQSMPASRPGPSATLPVFRPAHAGSQAGLLDAASHATYRSVLQPAHAGLEAGPLGLQVHVGPKAGPLAGPCRPKGWPSRAAGRPPDRSMPAQGPAPSAQHRHLTSNGHFSGCTIKASPPTSRQLARPHLSPPLMQALSRSLNPTGQIC